MTDAEWAALAPLVQPGGPGRPAADPRRLWDAIFWIACSREPWRALPEALGRADSAHRALRRHARNGTLDRLMIAASPHPLSGGDGLETLAWRILRAIRRVARLLTMAQLLMAKRLGLASALPCAPEHLPRPHLAATLHRLIPSLPGARPALLRWMIALHDAIPGERRLWRLTD
ncbi:transposase [Falsiroseomonas bella]|nr:transposase [Falsiroseomonas bella]